MESVETPERTVRIRAENVGGIDETDVELGPGVTLLTGRNASNRTSLLQAITAALGSDRASLKGDAEAGWVELEVDGETYRRTLERRGGEVVFDGDPYTEAPGPAELFAFLLGSNDARQAVARGDDLREVIMRPVDTDAIRAEIEQLEARRREIEAELDERERLAEEAAELERERDELDEQLREKRSALEDKRAEVDAADAELEATRERKAELESRLADLRERRSALRDVRYRLDTERETAEGLREEITDVEAALEDLDGGPDGDVERLDERIEELRGRKRRLDSRINQLQSLVQFNEEALDDEGVAERALESDAGSGAHVTSRLLGDDSFVCWTCGQEATRDDVAETLETLRDGRRELVEERGDVTAELERARDRKEERLERDRRRSELERRRDELETELAEAEAEVESLEERCERLREEVEGIEEDVERLRAEEYDEIVELHREANALELEVERLEADLEGTEDALASVRERLEGTESLETELADVERRLEEARTRVERLEEEAVEAFNDHVDAVLDALDYENLERIWIERTEREGRDGRRTTSRGRFELHVVRSTDAGAVYEDTVDHLSESEREVTGLVFALAGYLAHDVHETMPFVLLDSIEAVDSDRIAVLLEYLADYAEYLVVALLPEDAAAVDDRYREITDI